MLSSIFGKPWPWTNQFYDPITTCCFWSHLWQESDVRFSYMQIEWTMLYSCRWKRDYIAMWESKFSVRFETRILWAKSLISFSQVAKEDISVRFFEEKNGHVVWEGYGDFQHTNVHKQVAIAFRTPRYRTIEVEQPIKVDFTPILFSSTKFHVLFLFCSALYNWRGHRMESVASRYHSNIFH